MPSQKSRDKFERDLQVKLKRITEKHKREFRELLGVPPDLNNVPPAFWARAEDEIREQLAVLLIALYDDAMRSGGIGGAAPEVLGSKYAQSRAVGVARKYIQNSRDRASSIIGTDQLTDDDFLFGEEIESLEDVEDSINSVFDPNRIKGLARTEATFAQSAGGEEAAQILGTVENEDTWFTRNDHKVCPICEPLHGEPRSVWIKTAPLGPPAHPNCRCWIHYSREKGQIRSVR